MWLERLLAIWRRYARVPWGRGVLALASVCAVAFALGLAIGWPAVSRPAFQAPAGGSVGTSPPTPAPTATPTPYATAPSRHAPKAPPAHKPRPPRHIRRPPAPPPWMNQPPGFYAPGQGGPDNGFWGAPPPPPPGWYPAPGGWGPHGEHGPHGGGRHGGGHDG